jgi:hypothetical protein
MESGDIVSYAPLQSLGRASTQSAGRVLKCGQFFIGIGWFYSSFGGSPSGNTINGQDVVTFPSQGVVMDGTGYFDGTWQNMFIPNLTPTNNRFVWTVPTITIGPPTGLPKNFPTRFGPLVFTFDIDWQIISVADFAASVGGAFVDPGTVGMFAVAQFATPNRSLKIQFLNPVKPGKYNLLGYSNSQNFTTWTYAFSFDSGTKKNAFQINVATLAKNTVQSDFELQLVGASSGKIIDMATVTSAQALAYDTVKAFGSAEPFFPTIIFKPITASVPPIPDPSVSGFMPPFTFNRFWLSAFTQGTAFGGDGA